MGGANGWTYLPTIRRSFPERERHDFTGHLQSVNTGFCIDRRARPFLAHRLFVRVIPIALLLIFLVAALWDPSTCMVDQQRGKAQKFCPWPIVAWAPLWILEGSVSTYWAFYRYR